MTFDPNQAIGRMTAGQHLTDVQVRGYNFRLAEIYENNCGEAPVEGRELDRYYGTLKTFEIYQRMGGVTLLHHALPGSYEQWLVSRGCPDNSVRAVRQRGIISSYVDFRSSRRLNPAAFQEQREIISSHMELVDELWPSDDDFRDRLDGIVGAMRARQFTVDEELALAKIAEMMSWNDPFFVLAGIFLLNLISPENGGVRTPPEFTPTVMALASYDGELSSVFSINHKKILVLTAIDVLAAMNIRSSSAEPGVPPASSAPGAPSVPPEAIPAHGRHGASAAPLLDGVYRYIADAWEFLEDSFAAAFESIAIDYQYGYQITAADAADYRIVGWAEGELDFGYEADTGEWYCGESDDYYYGFLESAVSASFATDLIP